MKLTDYIIIFLIIFGSFGLITFYNTNLNSKSEIVETEYANALTIACQDAARTIKTEKADVGVWSDPNDRNYTLQTFYNTLNFCFNTEYTEKSDETKKYTPVVCLVDVDGYYLSYNTVLDHTESTYLQADVTPEDAYSFNSKNEALKSKDVKAYYEAMVATPINTWSQSYGDTKVRFYLNDQLEIVDPDGNTFRDTYRNTVKAYSAADASRRDKFFKSIEIKFNEPGSKVPIYEIVKDGSEVSDPNTLGAILGSKDVYENVKNKIITQSITDEVNYYINYQNIYNRNEEISYEYVMPDVAQEDWHRLLANPTVISFLQGRQAATGDILSNIYSIGGGELVKEGKYYITKESDGTYLYHYIPYVPADETRVYSRANTDMTHIPCDYWLKILPKMENKKVRRKIVGPDGKDAFEYIDEETLTQVYETSSNGVDYKEIEHTFDNMDECAKLGAMPCECVKNHN